MSIKGIKLVSSCLTLVGVGINLAINAMGDKILDDKIETKVAEALTKTKSN